MNSFFKEIFEYHHHFNSKLLDQIKLHLTKLPERSFPMFCHIMNAHYVWNARILKTTELYKVWQVHPIEQCQDIEDNNYRDTVKILDKVDLDEVIPYKTSKGQPFSNSIRDILFHASNHSTHHRAQIISDFRSVGVDPIVSDYIFFKR